MAHEAALLEYGSDVLDGVPHVRQVGTAPNRAGVLSFVFENGIHPHDVGTILDQGWRCAPATTARSR